MVVSKLWEICYQEIVRTWELRKNLCIDTFVIMPDHVHIIIIIEHKIIKNIQRNRDDGWSDQKHLQHAKIVNQPVDTPRGAYQQNQRGANLQNFGSYHDNHQWNNKFWPTLKHYTNKFGPQPPWSLQVIINQIKWSITRRINKIQPDIWFQRQPRYYERIIRDERELNNVRRYIEDNPRNFKK